MKRITKIFSLVLALLMLLSMAACGKKDTDKPKEPDEKKPVLLVVSFGTSYNESRQQTIGAVESALQKAYPDYEVRRAFTSQIIIDKLKERDGEETDNVTEAMKRLVADGVKDVVVQPTHVMPGFEYDDMVKEVSAYEQFFNTLKIGKPLLTSEEDFKTLADVLAKETADYNTDGTAVVWMGHGTEHKANTTYATMQKAFTDAGYSNYFVGTVEATPTLEDLIGLVKESGAKKVVLLPLMIVAGDHANNDMAGDEEDSWKTQFEKAGFEVTPVLHGLGQYPGVQEMIVKHADETMHAVGPISADQIANGQYNIQVESSSSMFNITDCVLTVENGKMTARMTMSGHGYGKLFMGTAEEAAKASEDAFCMDVQSTSDADDFNVFEVPVTALNTEINCAAWSINKEQWYDRVLVFSSADIPAESLHLK